MLRWPRSGAAPNALCQTLSESVWQSKLGRNTSIELALDPAQRAPAQDFRAASRAECDRLTEQSPAIDDAVIDVFRSRFDKYDVANPAIANGLDKCTIFDSNPDAPLSGRA